MDVSIIIASRNRLEDLRQTCSVIERLQPPPLEVLVTADGCADGTVDFIQYAHPHFRIIVNETAQGSVASRARMMDEVKGDLVLSLDDDSYPEQTDCLATLSSLFSGNPRLGVVTFPQRTDEYPETLLCTHDGEPRAVRSFPNSGACLRLSVYRSLPGFEPMFYHAYEEPEYALQCFAAGWDILLYPAITIRHHNTRRERNEIRTHHFHARNEFWSTLMRCLLPYAIGVVFYRVASQVRYACERGRSWVLREPL